MFVLNNITSLVANPFFEVKQIILNYIKSNIKITNIVNKYVFSNDGKMLRPLLLLLSAHTFNFYNKDCVPLAAAVELIHLSSLLHDDVLDNTNFRRGKKTVSAKWGNQCAILTGDFLYSKAFKLVFSIESRQKEPILSLLADTISVMVEGEMLQLSHQNNFTLNEKIYFQIIAYKTARLFTTSVQLPRLLNNNNNEYIARSMLNFGMNFGIAYQLLNDIEDYYNYGDDLLYGRITLPAIYALNNLTITSNFDVKEELIDLIKNYSRFPNSKVSHAKQITQFELIKSIIADNGGFKYTIKVAERYLNKAKSFMVNLPDSVYKQAVLEIIDELLLIKLKQSKNNNYSVRNAHEITLTF